LSATDMALIHNVFIRILNCIYLQAPNVKEEKDISDFITFTYSLIITLHEHHSNEEKFFFPWLEADIGTKGAMEKNIEQHHAFEPGLSAFEAYVVAVKDGKEKYDGAKIVALIDVFGSILAKHLGEEIGTFEELEKLGDKIDWKAWNKKVSKLAVDTAEKYHEIPIVLTNIDITFEKGVHEEVWPPYPWIAAVMFRWLYVPRHKGAWRFSCCDPHGYPRDLPFV